MPSVYGQLLVYNRISTDEGGLLKKISVTREEMDRIRLAVENPDDEEAGGAGELEDVITPGRLRARAREGVHQRLADANLTCDFSAQINLGRDIRPDREDAAEKEGRCLAFIEERRQLLGVEKLSTAQHNTAVDDFQTQEASQPERGRGKRRKSSRTGANIH